MDILNLAEMRRKDLCAAVDLDLDEDQTCRTPPVKVSLICAPKFALIFRIA